jgi:hypothetical protein
MFENNQTYNRQTLKIRSKLKNVTMIEQHAILSRPSSKALPTAHFHAQLENARSCLYWSDSH